jgi:FAD dependent oxidoreductase
MDQNIQLNYSAHVPVKYSADIVVVGGGIAGLTAACAAAKMGKSVILLESFAILGGNATSGGVGAFCGETRGQGAIFDEIITGLEHFHAIVPYQPYEQLEARVFNHEILPLVLQELALKYNVKLLLHSKLADCVVDNGRIKEIIFCGASGLEAISGKNFIDCTGQATLVHTAGFETMKGANGNHVQLPMSLMFFVRHLKDNDIIPKIPDDIIAPIKNCDDLPMTSIWPNGPHSNAIKIKIVGSDSTDTESLTDAEIRARRKMLSVLKYYVENENKKWMLDHCSPIIGIREGRRAVGEYILKVADLRAGGSFDDAVARGVFYLDGHDPNNDKRTYILPHDQLHVPPYQIPLRSLIVKGAYNLLVAGRCLSAEQLALSSARVMTTCAMTGQAAGVAAVKATEDDCAVNQIDGKEISRILQKNGAIMRT